MLRMLFRPSLAFAAVAAMFRDPMPTVQPLPRVDFIPEPVKQTKKLRLNANRGSAHRARLRRRRLGAIAFESRRRNWDA